MQTSLGVAKLGSKTDPYYQQDLGDLSWHLNAKLDGIPIRQDTDDNNLHFDSRSPATNNRN